MRSTCRRCGGKGTVISTPCNSCRGTGQTKQKKTVMVPVPAGQSHSSLFIWLLFTRCKYLKDMFAFIFNEQDHVPKQALL